jgi:RNA polymerase sigma-70 factor (ECF subfamily)
MNTVSATAWCISTTESRPDRNFIAGRRIDSYGVTALESLAEADKAGPFADLVAPLIPAAQRLAYGMLQNPQDCEDAVQEATFKAWRAFPRLRENSDLRAWFLTIVANECRQRRRNRWWSILKMAEPADDLPSPIREDEGAMDLRRAVARLPHEMKLAIVLRFYLDLPFQEIARVLNVSNVAARARVYRALQRLRVEIPEMSTDA